MQYLLLALIGISILSIILLSYARLKDIPIQIDSVLYEDEELKIRTPYSIIQTIGNYISYYIFLIERVLLLVKRKINRIFGLKKEKTRGFSFDSDFYPLWPSFGKWQDLNKPSAATFNAGPAYRPLTKEITLTGSINLPTRAYVGDTYIVNLELLPEFIGGYTPTPKMEIKHDESGTVSITLGWESMDRWLHIRLIGVGIKITPLDSETQNLFQGVCSYSWGCSFVSSGLHTIALRCTLSSSYNSGSLSCSKAGLNHSIKVVQFDHLTSRQIKVIAGFTAAISTLLSIILGLNGLGVLP
jgi:hypothetical protein